MRTGRVVARAATAVAVAGSLVMTAAAAGAGPNGSTAHGAAPGKGAPHGKGAVHGLLTQAEANGAGVQAAKKKPKPGVVVVADNLNNPRGLALDDGGGKLYVAEAGSGGSTCLGEDPELGVTCVGLTAAITEVDRNGHHQNRIVTGLASGASPDGSEATGVDDVAVDGGHLFGIMTSAGPAPLNLPGLGAADAQLGNLLQFNRGNGKHESVIADIDDYEFAHDPDNAGLDSDPYGVGVGRGGQIAVADAAGNDVLLVDKKGTVSLLGVIPCVVGPPSADLSQCPAQPVPTTVKQGPDGAWYVATLDLGAFFGLGPGHARIFRMVPGAAPQQVASGLNTVTGIAFGKDGSLYATELFTGRVVKFSRNFSTMTELVGFANPLPFPSGIAVADNGDVYVSINSVAPAGGVNIEAGPGQTVHLDGGKVIRFHP